MVAPRGDGDGMAFGMRHTGGALAMLLALVCAGAPDAWPDTPYRLVPAESELRILVYRAGPLAGLGHNHVAITRSLSGGAMLDRGRVTSLAMEFPVASLVLDEAAARADEGPAFGGEVSAEDIEATRENMLGSKLLDADAHPTIRIESTGISGSPPGITVQARVTVRGRPHMLDVPVSVNTFEGGLVATGRLRVTHEAIGLEPFRAAFGSLRVADEMLVKFRVVARADGSG